MAQTSIVVAVVPVAFFTQDHIEMTRTFLDNLQEEVDWIGIWHNGGTLAAEGAEMMQGREHVLVTDAQSWGFYKMWNEGVKWAQHLDADVCLVLNNDIEWEPGVLRSLAAALDDAPPDVAVASPDPDSDYDPNGIADINATPAYRGLMGWCFAVRPTMWQQIDERYQVWYGDDEIGLLMVEAGWRCVRAKGCPVHHSVSGQTTMKYRDGLWDMIRADEALYNSKWT